MHRFMVGAWLLLGLGLGLQSELRADLAGAQASFKQGLALEKGKQYAEAIKAYEASLAAEPRYAYANKQIGNCRYYLGDKPGALQAYDAYLAVVKNDPKTQAFADRLRGELGAAGAPAAGGAGAAVAGELAAGKRWRVGADLGYRMVSFKDWNDAWKSVAASGTPPKVDSGVSVGLLAGYKVLPKLELGLDLDYLLVGVGVKATASMGSFYSYESTTDFRFNTLWIGPFVGYDVLAFSNGVINLGLGAGYVTLMGAGADSKSTVTTYGSSSSSTGTTTYSGSTVGFKAKAGLDWQASPTFSAYFDLGYVLSSVGTVTYSSSSTSGGSTVSSSGTLKKADGSTLPYDYSGLDLQLGAAFKF